MSGGSAPLPETAAVYWRPRVDARRLRPPRAHVDGDHLRAHGAVRRHRGPAVRAGAAVVPGRASRCSRTRGRSRSCTRGAGPTWCGRSRRATTRPSGWRVGLLGDLVGHDARELHARTGLVPERGALGVWLVGEAGAVLVAPGGRRVFCWCVKVPEPGLPAGRPHRAPAARAALRRAGLRHRGEPRVQRRPVAAAPPDAPAHAAGAGRGGAVVQGVESRVVNIGSTVHGGSALIGPMMLSMSTSAATRRLVLVPAATSPRDRPLTPGVRRFRLAQLRLEGREVPRSERFAHLKRTSRLDSRGPDGPGPDLSAAWTAARATLSRR